MKDLFNRKWIIDNSITIVNQYEKSILTLRGLHYRLVSLGMTNDLVHYKKVVNSIISARWEGLIKFDVFSDNDRAMIGYTKNMITNVETEINNAKYQINAWMNSYNKNRWENQYYYPEVFIEKKALQGVFGIPCKTLDVGLGACKGYPSLTFLYDTAQRLKYAEEEGKQPVLLYFGDYDPSGEDIPRSIEENIKKLGCQSIELRRISLLEEQVVDWKLPPAPVKIGDSRSANWNGLGQVELDAIAPEKLQELCTNAILSVFDFDDYNELLDQQKEERIIYKNQLKEYTHEL